MKILNNFFVSGLIFLVSCFAFFYIWIILYFNLDSLLFDIFTYYGRQTEGPCIYSFISSIILVIGCVFSYFGCVIATFMHTLASCIERRW